jgi:hypothetical protein
LGEKSRCYASVVLPAERSVYFVERPVNGTRRDLLVRPCSIEARYAMLNDHLGGPEYYVKGTRCDLLVRLCSVSVA